MSLHPRDAKIVAEIIKREGGSVFTNDPIDAGGATRWGVSMRALEQHRGQPVTARDVELLTREEAEDIYAARYIRPFDGLPHGLRENVIDFGVNAGVERATRLLQQLVGASVDGVMGPQTRVLSAQGSWGDGYCYMRLAFYEALIEKKPSQVRFRQGWRARALSFRSVA